MKKFQILLCLPLIFLISAHSTNSESFTLKAEANPPGLDIGAVVPELEGRMPNGEPMKLSDLRGQIVLIDFWASWCGPCRHSMPLVTSAYSKHKDSEFEGGSGFTVFSVSLDQNLKAWKKGIADLGQVWPNHISDLRGWRSMHAAKYGVNAIPAAFLIDGEGRLIARNVQPYLLEGTLKKLTR